MNKNVEWMLLVVFLVLFLAACVNQNQSEGIGRTVDIAYGSDPLQRLDIYKPVNAVKAPVIFMVHGGGWRHGDKAGRSVAGDKMQHWVNAGFIFISVNYRLLPDANPYQQAEDVARALAFAQRQAPTWGGDAGRFILIGHSAGAHLVSLLATRADLVSAAGAQPWLGTVSIDTAAFDVPAVMQRKHLRLYDQAFGTDEVFWRSVSPMQHINADTLPLLAICSTRRGDHPCDDAEIFKQQALPKGVRVELLPVDLSHGQTNRQLGQPGAYTAAVDAFLASLDPLVAKMLPAR